MLTGRGDDVGRAEGEVLLHVTRMCESEERCRSIPRRGFVGTDRHETSREREHHSWEARISALGLRTARRPSVLHF